MNYQKLDDTNISSSNNKNKFQEEKNLMIINIQKKLQIKMFLKTILKK